MEQNEIIQDSESYRDTKSGYGFKEICLRQVQRVVTCASQEWRRGFWIYSTPSPNIVSQKIRYVGDTREEFCNAVLVLHDLLLPKFEKEKGDMFEDSQNFDEQQEKLAAKYMSLAKEGNREKLFDDFWQEKLKIHRQLFQSLICFLESLGWLETEAIED